MVWLWILAGLVALAGIILAAWKLPLVLYGDVRAATPDARLQAASGFRTAVIAGLAGLAALGSLAMATRTYRLTQQGQITERYTRAIEQLGSDKLDVRLGGIYALERIARDSKRDQPTVVEVLSAFVREHSDPAHTDSKPSVPKALRTFLQRNNEVTASRQSDAENQRRRRRPTANVQAALMVLGRLPFLSGDVPRADLSNAHFVGADLSGMKMNKFLLAEANLLMASLKQARLGGSSLWRANLEGANLQQALLDFAVLEEANLREANLQQAFINAANLKRTDLQGANLQGAVLFRTSLDLANLKGATLEGAALRGASLLGAFLDGVQLQGAECSADTVWPDGFDWRAAGVILG